VNSKGRRIQDNCYVQFKLCLRSF